MAETNYTCASCRYFIHGQLLGMCKRFPLFHNKHENDWCGEFDAKIVRIEPAADVAPVVEFVHSEQKRRGRPPKVQL